MIRLPWFVNTARLMGDGPGIFPSWLRDAVQVVGRWDTVHSRDDERRLTGSVDRRGPLDAGVRTASGCRGEADSGAGWGGCADDYAKAMNICDNILKKCCICNGNQVWTDAGKMNGPELPIPSLFHPPNGIDPWPDTS